MTPFVVLASLTSAHAQPAVTLGGICPGPVTMNITGLTPGGAFYMVASNNLGTTPVPGGPCAGINLPLGAPLSPYGPFTDGDGDGEHMFNVTFPPGACSKWISALDVASCTPSSPPVSFLTPGGPYACGNFGDTLAEHTFGPNTWIIDPDRVVVTPTEIHVLTFSDAHTFDHDLNLLRGPSPITPGGNMGMQYNPVTDNIYGYLLANANPQMTVWDSGLTTELNSFVPPTTNTGSGVVDPYTGRLHVTGRSSGSMHTYDEAGTYHGSWAPESGWGQDAHLGPFGDIYITDRVSGVLRYDAATLTYLGSFPAYDADAIAVDDNGTVYLLDRGNGTLDAFAKDGTILGTVSYGSEEASSIEFNPWTRELVVGFFNGGSGIARRVCPYSP